MALSLRASLRYYSPEKAEAQRFRWRQQPHIFFANLKIDWESLLLFDKTFGGLLNEHWRLMPTQKHEIAITEADVQLAQQMQGLLRGAWRGDQTAIELLQFGATHYAEQQAYGPIQIKPVPTSHGVDIYAPDLWTYVRVAFLNDQSRARVCENPDCAAPYFLAKRKDARLCGNEACSAWAQRQWSLDHWRSRGEKLRKLRKAKAQARGKGRKSA
jgi:hypothetical protein